jgi:hypothetical protein
METPNEEGWKFSDRVYEVRYLDTTPLASWSPARAVVDKRLERMERS